MVGQGHRPGDPERPEQPRDRAAHQRGARVGARRPGLGPAARQRRGAEARRADRRGAGGPGRDHPAGRGSAPGRRPRHLRGRPADRRHGRGASPAGSCAGRSARNAARRRVSSRACSEWRSTSRSSTASPIIVIALAANLLSGIVDAADAVRDRARGDRLGLAEVTYLLIFWVLAGQTPGMRFLGLQLRSGDRGDAGPPPGVQADLGDRRLDILALGLGFLPILTDERRRGWFDRMAGTEVFFENLDRSAPWSDGLEQDAVHEIPLLKSGYQPGDNCLRHMLCGASIRIPSLRPF